MLTGFHMDTQRLYANIRIAVPLCVLSFEKTPFQQEVWPQPLFQPEMYNSFSKIHITLLNLYTYIYLFTGEGSMASLISSSRNLLRRPPTQATPVETVQVVVVVVVAVVVDVR